MRALRLAGLACAWRACVGPMWRASYWCNGFFVRGKSRALRGLCQRPACAACVAGPAWFGLWWACIAWPAAVLRLARACSGPAVALRLFCACGGFAWPALRTLCALCGLCLSSGWPVRPALQARQCVLAWPAWPVSWALYALRGAGPAAGRHDRCLLFSRPVRPAASRALRGAPCDRPAWPVCSVPAAGSCGLCCWPCVACAAGCAWPVWSVS